MFKTLLIILFLALALDAKSYKFEEYRYVQAVDVKFKKTGVVFMDKDVISITYDAPKYQKVISSKDGVTIDKGEGDVQKLEGRALTYTKVYLELIRELDNVKNYKDNKNFSVEKYNNTYTLFPKGDKDFRIDKIIIKTNKAEVKSFKMFMTNEDIIEIVKI